MQKLNRTSLDTAATDAPELIWAPLPSTVAGRLPIAELPTFQLFRDLPAIAFARFDIEVKQAGSVIIELSAPSDAVSMWLDGRPRKLPEPDEAIGLSVGRHRVVLGLKVRSVGPSLGCQIRTGHLGSAVLEWK
jgi:hypothetical protein